MRLLEGKNMKYNKYRNKIIKIITYILILIFVIAANAYLGFISFKEKNSIGFIIISVIIDFLGIGYCIFQDLLNAIHIEKFQKYEYKNSEIPFVDRETILDEILGSVKEILTKDNDFRISFNFKYGDKIGKKSLSDKLCRLLIDFRDNNKNKEDKKIRKRIGNIFLINYDNEDDFIINLKRISLLKGKRNIVVVQNNYVDILEPDKRFEDKNILFIFLNFNHYSKKSLDFRAKEIKLLLKELKNNAKYSSKIPENDDALNKLSEKLEELSNIGNVVSIITSDEFDILLYTDNKFIEFYNAIKDANYSLAENFYDKIKLPVNGNDIYKYKLEYEKANLLHFRGNYPGALEIINKLIDEISINNNFKNEFLLKKMYKDSILLKSHIQKHIGDFQKSLKTLEDKDNLFFNNTLLWIRSHFSVYIFKMNTLEPKSYDWNKDLKNVKTLMENFKNIRTKEENSNYYFYEAFFPIIEFYSNNFDKNKINDLIEIEEKAINYYEQNERRYLTNCLFIKAEFLRILNKFEEASVYYKKCYDIYEFNGDLDILFLLAITEKYIEVLNGHKLNIVSNYEEILKECKNRGEIYKFHNNLIVKLEQKSTLKGESIEELKEWYSKTITPIP